MSRETAAIRYHTIKDYIDSSWGFVSRSHRLWLQVCLATSPTTSVVALAFGDEFDLTDREKGNRLRFRDLHNQAVADLIRGKAPASIVLDAILDAHRSEWERPESTLLGDNEEAIDFIISVVEVIAACDLVEKI